MVVLRIVVPVLVTAHGRQGCKTKVLVRFAGQQKLVGIVHVLIIDRDRAVFRPDGHSGQVEGLVDRIAAVIDLVEPTIGIDPAVAARHAVVGDEADLDRAEIGIQLAANAPVLFRNGVLLLVRLVR